MNTSTSSSPSTPVLLAQPADGRPGRRWLRRGLLGALATTLVGLGAGLADAWTALGRTPDAVRRRSFERSPQWREGRFHNPQPLWNDWLGMGPAALRSSPDATPNAPVAISKRSATDYALPPSSGLRITWLGHSTTLIEIDGQRVLTDPVWGPRASPVSWAGVKRWYEPPLALDDLPALDAVLISHDHYDHLDHSTIVALRDKAARFIVPLGVGSHLEYWGVPASRITELDWWESASVGTLKITGTPARHASGRSVLDKDATLWSGYALRGPRHAVYFSGDTGMQQAFPEIARRLGPFNASLIEVGEYNPAWPDWHIGPEQAVTAHRQVQGGLLIPIHWGLFKLAPHAWTEPVERALRAAKSQGVPMATPRPGEQLELHASPLEPTTAPASERWWPDTAWQDASQSPQLSTLDGLKPQPAKLQ